jgi:hypothetical protein
MGESRCGHLALEASVALCRAMTQLEVGEMAVVSFGARGNTRLVHPFERPFTDEAGASVVSQFSFRQDNTIADEPVVDLLRFLSTVLETARQRVTRATAGGGNQLQQLVLIIADGRFHEKVRGWNAAVPLLVLLRRAWGVHQVFKSSRCHNDRSLFEWLRLQLDTFLHASDTYPHSTLSMSLCQDVWYGYGDNLVRVRRTSSHVASRPCHPSLHI